MLSPGATMKKFLMALTLLVPHEPMQPLPALLE